ncbi:Sov1p Ecym_3411 [Eremothecium cymbalariae DBVPG|uniref:Uncharacterized protein n=1 Tax=Eremothecium cymbalariae (strain CBS 270.75 / DBVPG 7215 / KCTC 17166 / NRRL Y-17582) TaxID=931890 RepID=G8JRX8_ERECY|nr:Hypothetical protein Ecym_3411 [Eremothecium cymbalariae DBVPG\
MLRYGVKPANRFCLIQIRCIRSKPQLSKVAPTTEQIAGFIQEQHKGFPSNESHKRMEIKENQFLDMRNVTDKRFEDSDDFIHLLELKNPGFKKSVLNLRRLKIKLKSLPPGSNDKFKEVFDYLLRECEGEITRMQTMSPEKFKETVDNNKLRELEMKKIKAKSETELSDVMFHELLMKNRDDSIFQNTEELFRLMLDLVTTGDKIISVEQMVQAFELSKLIPSTIHRLRGIFLSGRLLYSLGTVRMDPVNESFYIEALLYHGHFRQAIHLFETYKDKVDQRWWYEIGMMTLLRANKIHKFDQLFKRSLEKFGSDYFRSTVIKTAIQKKLYMRDFAAADRLTDFFLDIADRYGCARDERIESHMKTFENEEQANLYLNAIQKPTDKDFNSIIQAHVFRKNQKTALKTFAKYIQRPEFGDADWSYCITKMQLPLLKDYEFLKEAIEPFLEPGLEAERLKKLERIFNVSLEKLGVPEIKRALDVILYQNINRFTLDSKTTDLIHKYIVRNWISPTETINDDDLSKKFYGILKILLANGKIESSKKLVKKLEESDGSNYYPKVNGHHYAAIIDYYLRKVLLTKSRAKRASYSKEVTTIFDGMKKMQLDFNSRVISSLLAFYRNMPDFNNCFALINRLFDYKLAQSDATDQKINLSPFYGRRIINVDLYGEVWRCYLSYYTKKSDWTLLHHTSNSVGWKNHVMQTMKETKIHPTHSMLLLFKTMVEDDNILISSNLYGTIIRSFIKGRNWTSLPAVIEYMRSSHGVELEKRLKAYVEESLKREYVAFERQKLGIINSTLSSPSKLAVAKKRVDDMINNNVILKSHTDNDVDDTIIKLLEYLSKVNKEDISTVMDVYKILKLDVALINKLMSKDYL